MAIALKIGRDDIWCHNKLTRNVTGIFLVGTVQYSTIGATTTTTTTTTTTATTTTTTTTTQDQGGVKGGGPFENPRSLSLPRAEKLDFQNSMYDGDTICHAY